MRSSVGSSAAEMRSSAGSSAADRVSAADNPTDERILAADGCTSAADDSANCTPAVNCTLTTDDSVDGYTSTAVTSDRYYVDYKVLLYYFCPRGLSASLEGREL